MKAKHNFAITVVCIVLGITVAWQYQSITDNKNKISFENKTADELKNQLISESSNNDSLRKRLDEVSQKARELENIKGGNEQIVKTLQDETKTARIIAGLLPVKGKGLIVKMEDSKTADVRDNHIVDMLNEMRASGAQAMSVNEERIVATSEVRAAGGYIVVNGKQMKAPFTIKAIAEPEKLENALKMIGGQIEYLEYYGIKITTEKSEDLTIPKVRDDGTVIKYNLLTPVGN